MYKPNEYLEAAIATKNVVRIKSAFTVMAPKDPSFSTGEFDQALEYVKSQNINALFTPFDGASFQPEEDWDEDYWALVVSSLMDNFCMERINHLKEISRVLYPPKASPKPSGTNDQYTDRGTSQKQGNGVPPKKAVPIAITAGLAVTCAVGVAVGAKGMATAVGVAAIATGLYLAFKE